MINNYLKLAWRNLQGDRTFSLINILGLTIGLAVALLLFLYITFEYSFDSNSTPHSTVFRVLLDLKDESGEETWAILPSAVAPSIATNIPEIIKSSRVWKNNYGANTYIETEEKQLIEKNFSG